MQGCICENEMIKAIFFDMGGVLVDLRVEECKEAFKSRIGFYKIDELLDACHQKGIIGDMEAGRIGAPEFCDEVRKDCPGNPSDEMIFNAFNELLGRVPTEKLDYLKRLCRRYPLFLLSNANPIAMQRVHEIFAEEGCGMEEIFREIYVSCFLKMLKPGAEIFREAARRSGFREDEILFIDDSRPNVDGAVAAGYNAVYYERGTDLEALVESELKKYN